MKPINQDMPALDGFQKRNGLFKRLFLLVLIPYGLWLIFAYHYHFIDGVNLLFHEAGHVFFGFFGETIHFLGGTLGQLIFPVACLIHFHRKGEIYEAAICGLWLAGSMMYMAEYLGDAQAQSLPLVGGHIHDWNWLLSKAGLLDSCESIAGFIHVLASLLVLVCLIVASQQAFLKTRGNELKDNE